MSLFSYTSPWKYWIDNYAARNRSPSPIHFISIFILFLRISAVYSLSAGAPAQRRSATHSWRCAHHGPVEMQTACTRPISVESWKNDVRDVCS